MKRCTYKASRDGYEDVGLREGVTVDDAICALADLEEILFGADDTERISAQRLSELADADADGRNVVTPCKIGNTAYFIAHGQVYEGTVNAICMYETPRLDSITIAGDACTPTAFRTEKIGKTVFFSHEEAEAAFNPDGSS